VSCLYATIVFFVFFEVESDGLDFFYGKSIFTSNVQKGMFVSWFADITSALGVLAQVKRRILFHGTTRLIDDSKPFISISGKFEIPIY